MDGSETSPAILEIPGSQQNYREFSAKKKLLKSLPIAEIPPFNKYEPNAADVEPKPDSRQLSKFINIL